MTTRNTPSATITLTDLARLAGVGRNAVSNWRRREPDFPAPVDESARRPRFSLDDLEAWAGAHGRDLRVTAADRAWFAASAAHPGAESALAAVAAAFDGHGEPALAKQLKDIDADRAELFEFFIERAREAAGTGVPPGIAPLADIAGIIGAGAASVHDPACDEGDLLAATARHLGPGTAYTGTDLAPGRAAIARLRLELLSGRAPVDISVADALLSPLPADRYDLVVCDPPFNLKDWGHDRLPAGDDPRLSYGTPPRTEPELAWALHCTALLAPGGHAVVRMPAQVAHRRTGRRIRSELLRWGALRAVVDHPDAKAHLWILGPSGEAAQLLVSNGRDFAEAWRAFSADSNAPMATADSATVPLMRLWDEDVDISPAVYLAGAPGDTTDLAADFEALTARLAALTALPLPRFTTGTEESAPETSLADLERDGHLHIAPGAGAIGATGGPGGPGSTGDTSGSGDDARCAIVDPVGEPPVRLGLAHEATEAQWTITCGPTTDLGWIAAALAARLPNAAKRTATGAKRRLLSVKIPRLPLEEQRRRGAAYARLETLRSSLAAAEAAAAALAAATAAGLVSGAVRVED